MADFEFRLPDIGEGVAEGEIVEWHVKPGDSVREDDPLVDVMTDKATVQIGSPRAGSVRRIAVAAGTVARVGEVLVVIDCHEGEVETPASTVHVAATHVAATSDVTTPGASTNGDVASAVGDIRHDLPGVSAFRALHLAASSMAQGTSRAPSGQAPSGQAPSAAAPHAAPTPQTTALARGGGAQLTPPRVARHNDRERVEDASERVRATPYTRRRARELGVSLEDLRGRVYGERVTWQDVCHIVDERNTRQPSQASQQRTSAQRRIPFVGVRRAIAERMQLAKRTAAHFTFVEECDATRLMAVRDKFRHACAARGVSLTYLPFIVKATARALERHPLLNSRLDEERREIVIDPSIHIGIAVASEKGVVVPVLRDANHKSVFDIALELDALSQRARRGHLRREEMTGSTFTITSLGKQGGLLATPVLNFPEVGILGVHRIKERPVVSGGRVVVGHVMNLSLSFDHRIVDGDVGASFAYSIIDMLEEPALIFADLPSMDGGTGNGTSFGAPER